MPDNWEFALTHARGEFFTFLTDDSYLLPDTIERAMHSMEALGTEVGVWRHAAYYAPDWPEPKRNNVLHVPKLSGTAIPMKSTELLDRLYGMDMSVVTAVPKSLNSICSRRLADKVIESQGRFFLPPAPDYTSAASVLMNTDFSLLLDWIGFLDGVTPASIGATASLNWGESAAKFMKEFNCPIDDILFFGIHTPTSGIGRSLEIVSRHYSHGPRLRMNALVKTISDDLARLEAHGANVDVPWKALSDYVHSEGSPGLATFNLWRAISRLKWLIVYRARLGAYTRHIERFRGLHIMDGRVEGFSNIEEAAAAMPGILQRR